MSVNSSWRRPSNCTSHLSRTLIRFVFGQQNPNGGGFTPFNDFFGHESYMVQSQTFYESMKACSSLKSASIAPKIHAQLISTGLVSSTFLQNHLSHMYFNCGLVDDGFRVFREIELPGVHTWNTVIGVLSNLGKLKDAEQVFDEMAVRDSVSWNSMISGYFRNGQPRDAVKVFCSMIRDCSCVPGPVSFTSTMKACAKLGYLAFAIQLHGLVIKFGFQNESCVQTSLVDMYIRCGSVNLADRVFLRMSTHPLFCWNSMIFAYSKLYGAEGALELFGKMPKRDSVSWSTMISILSQHGSGAKTLEMFVDMWNQGFGMNSMTYASVLSACTSIHDLGWGTHLHSRIIRLEQRIDAFVGSGLIDMYAKCGRLGYARQVFDAMTEHNAVSWTSLIRGVALSGLAEEAGCLFNQMRDFPVAVDEFALATVLGVCSSQKDICYAKQLHAYRVKLGMDSFVPVGNALITAYANCGNFQMACLVFESMPIKDIISWTAMMTAFSQNGHVNKAREYFDKMPQQNVITWNSMLTAYMQHGFLEEGFKLYTLMLKRGVNPDWITFSTLIGACADAAVLKLGNQITAQAKKLGIDSNVSVANSILTMYSRCGRIDEACKVFDLISVKNIISWNAMMGAYAQNGQGRKVIGTFENMLKLGCTPDHISYVSVLTGCSHSGLILEGQHYFNSMVKVHGISPKYEHYACMVDLLGRFGMLGQAVNMIQGMPVTPNADIWGALLGACRIHGNTNLAEFAVKNLLELNAEGSGSYVLLSNIYSDSCKLSSVADVRKRMKEKGIRKDPGCSWIEFNNTVHVFTSDDTNHPQINEVYKMLENVIMKIEGMGNYTTDTNSVRSQRYVIPTP